MKKNLSYISRVEKMKVGNVKIFFSLIFSNTFFNLLFSHDSEAASVDNRGYVATSS